MRPALDACIDAINEGFDPYIEEVTQATEAATEAAEAANLAREGIQTDLAAKADKTGTYSTLTAGGTTPDSVTDGMLVQTGGVLERVDSIESELMERYALDLSFMSGTIESNGTPSNNNTRIRLRNQSMPQIQAGDVVTCSGDYKCVVRVFTTNQAASTYYVGLTPSAWSNEDIPLDAYVGYYANIVIIKTGYESSDISADVDVVGEYVKYTRVKNTLDELSANLTKVTDSQQTAVLDGRMSLPNEFGSLPFSVVRNGGRYSIDLTESDLAPDQTVVYISDSSTETGAGTDRNHPITLEQWRVNRNANLYTTESVKLKFIERAYFLASTAPNEVLGTGNSIRNVMFEGVDGDRTWIGYGKKNPTWEQHSGSIYKTADATQVSDLVDLTSFKDDGLPSIYVKVASVDEVDAAGKFANAGGIVYVWPYGMASDIALVYGRAWSNANAGVITVRRQNAGNTIFKDLGFLSDSLNTRFLQDIDLWYYFFNCRFHRGPQDSFALNGYYKALLVNCAADYGSKDCFNYHSASKDSVAIELNCFAYGAGQYKMWDISGHNTTTDSCNDSTAHDGMCVARFGCSYWTCEGAPCADVNNVVTYCAEVTCKDILPTISNELYKAAFMLHDNRGVANPRRTDEHQNYLIKCSGGGSNITYGVRCAGIPIMVAGFCGQNNFFDENGDDITETPMVI